MIDEVKRKPPSDVKQIFSLLEETLVENVGQNTFSSKLRNHDILMPEYETTTQSEKVGHRDTHGNPLDFKKSPRYVQEEATVEQGEITHEEADFIPKDIFRNIQKHLNNHKHNNIILKKNPQSQSLQENVQNRILQSQQKRQLYILDDNHNQKLPFKSSQNLDKINSPKNPVRLPLLQSTRQLSPMPSMKNLHDNEVLKTFKDFENIAEDAKNSRRIQYKFKSIDRQIDRQLNNLSSQINQNTELVQNLKDIFNTNVEENNLPQINFSGQVMRQQRSLKFKIDQQDLAQYEKMSEFLCVKKAPQPRNITNRTPLVIKQEDIIAPTPPKQDEFLVSAFPVHRFERQPKLNFNKRNSIGVVAVTPDENIQYTAQVKRIPKSITDKSLNSRRLDILKNIPQISAKCWAIYDVAKMQFIQGKREYLKREMASLTKIMTCYVVIKLCQQWNLNIKKQEICVSAIASDIRGTSANLETGDTLTVEHLLHGLMLPSGNDAAFALAQFFGKQLFRRKYTHADISRIKSYQFNYHPYYAKYFLKEMNDQAEKLHMTSTFFDSPHGLMNIQNFSTAHDISKLSAICMKIEYFRKIVSTKVYECVGRTKHNIEEEPREERKRKIKQREQGENFFDKDAPSVSSTPSKKKSGKEPGSFHTRTFKWYNTNNMLNFPGYNGLKTGVTDAAGPCLSASYQKGDVHVVIVLFNSKTMEARWEEIPQLLEWAKERIKIFNEIRSSIMVGQAPETDLIHNFTPYEQQLLFGSERK